MSVPSVTVLWILVAIALVLLIVALLILRSSMVKKDGGKIQATPDPKAAPSPTSKEPEDKFAARSASASFAAANRFLRSHVAGADYRYRVPLCIVAGDPGAGKTALLEGAGADLARGEDTPLDGELEWRFLEHGILLGVPGAYFAPKNGRGGDAHGWGKLLSLLRNHRPRRPMDAMVLAIPATDLTGPEELDATRLKTKAGRYAEIVSQARKALNFNIPVYLVVTKCDAIPGFANFCRELPARCRDEVFGWSSPYSLETVFSGDWVDEGFDSMSRDLDRLQSEIFVERSDIARPDDVFLFPGELVRLREPIRVYLSRLLQQTAYQEAIRFRGIYFCGEIPEIVTSSEVAPPVEEGPFQEWPAPALAEIPSAAAAPLSSQSARNEPLVPVFLKDLFDRKIFAESGVAQPLTRVSFARNRAVLATQIAALALVLILGIGTWRSERILQGDADILSRMMSRIESTGGHSKAEIQALLQDIVPAGNISFRSIFLPTSLLSQADDRITDVMTYAVQNYLVADFETTLKARYDQVLFQDDKASAKTASDGNQQDQALATSIENTVEFGRLKTFVDDLKQLNDNLTSYNRLQQCGQSGGAEQVGSLVNYLYGKMLPPLLPGAHLTKALETACGIRLTSISGLEDRPAALLVQKITDLFDVWFLHGVPAADVDDLTARMDELEKNRVPIYTALTDLQGSMKTNEADFGNDAFKWVGSSHYEIGGSLREIADSVTQNKNLGINTLNQMQSLGNQRLQQLRTMIRDASTDTIGRIYDVQNDSIKLSRETKLLQATVDKAIQLSFISAGASPALVNPTDATQRLVWQVEPLQQAVLSQDEYTRFSAEALTGLPERLKTLIDNSVRAKMTQAAQGLIFRAETFSPRIGDTVLAADETQAEVASFRDARDTLIKLSAAFKKFGNVNLGNSISQVLTSESLTLLDELASQLDERGFYVVRDGNFDWWAGAPLISQTAFDYESPAELANYLTTQREAIRTLEQQAEPLVQFLGTTKTAKKGSYARWQKIIGDFQDYDGKKPASSLHALEDFITTGMDTVTPEHSCKGANTLVERDTGADYFIDVRNKLTAALRTRCEKITSDSAYKSYTRIAQVFQDTLAGRFPFGATDSRLPAAAPSDVIKFYQLLTEQEATARRAIGENAAYGESGERATAFLNQMDNLRAFAIPAIPDTDKQAPPFTLRFIPRFRVNTPHESGAGEIIEWTLYAGGTVFHKGEPDHPGEWRTGMPVRLALRWANESNHMPAPGQPNVRVAGRNAYFEYTDPWALLSLFARHKPTAADLDSTPDSQPMLLRFDVRTIKDPNWNRTGANDAALPAVLFLQLRLTAPVAGKELPEFPFAAPMLELTTASRN